MINLAFKGSPRELMDYIGKQICEDCYGKGILYFMEQDSDGHYANTGVKTCPCQLIITDFEE